jgi:hypothetical protein
MGERNGSVKEQIGYLNEKITTFTVKVDYLSKLIPTLTDNDEIEDALELLEQCVNSLEQFVQAEEKMLEIMENGESNT